MRKGIRATCVVLVALLSMSFAGCICIIDPNNQSIFEFDENTGFYVFTDCATGTEIAGMGQVTKKGLVYTIKDVQADRRVLAIVDMTQKKGTAAVQLVNPSRTFSIVGKNVIQSAQGCEFDCPGTEVNSARDK